MKFLFDQMDPDEQLVFYKAIAREMLYFGMLALFLFGFYSSCYQPHRIPTGSMIPALMVGDYILVDKSAYGLTLPFTDIYLNEPTGPRRGEVIVFKYPERPSLNYIKRVVGIPGDTVELRDHEWIVNGERWPLEKLPQLENPESWIEERYLKDGLEAYQTTTGEQSHLVLMKSEPKGPKNIRQFTLRENEYFVVGDNRDFSEDSRHWGVVHRSLIRGRALFVWFNLVGPFSEGGPRVKWGRLGHRL